MLELAPVAGDYLSDDLDFIAYDAYDAPTDLSHDSAYYPGASEGTNYPTTQGYETGEGYDDSKTNYLIASSTAGSRKETYISELVEDLSKSMPTAPGVGDDAVMERLHSTFPGLLKSFARKVGHLG